MNLKALTIAILSLAACNGYTQTADEQAILELEISGLRDYYGRKPSIRAFDNDSLFIARYIFIPHDRKSGLKKYLVSYKGLTDAEAEDIFGDQEFSGTIEGTEWSYELLPDAKILLYDEEIKKRFKGIFGSPNPIGISAPLIRTDGKFALIQMFDRTLGGLLHIYKKENGEWILYKQIQMSLV